MLGSSTLTHLAYTYLLNHSFIISLLQVYQQVTGTERAVCREIPRQRARAAGCHGQHRRLQQGRSGIRSAGVVLVP